MKSVRDFGLLSILVVAVLGCDAGGGGSAVPLPPPADDPPAESGRKVLSVPFFPQQTEVWCWAATSGMVLEYFGSPWLECEIASYWLSGGYDTTSCCFQPDLCLQPAPFEAIQWILYGLGGIDSLQTFSALSFSDLRYEIDQGHPMVLFYAGSFIGHFVVLYGYDAITQTVFVHDPVFGSFEVPYGSAFHYGGQLTWANTLILEPL